MKKIHKVFLGLGSNLGDKQENIKQSIKLIENRIGRVVGQSDFIITKPIGFKSNSKFVNAVIELETAESPYKVLQITQEIERGLGRTHKSTNGIYHDRVIDIDILLYDDITISTYELTIPHPRMKERQFVLLPLSQICPDLIMPGETSTIAEMLCQLC